MGDNQDDTGKSQEDAEKDDNVDTAPATTGHSDADTQAQRNAEDESPS